MCLFPVTWAANWLKHISSWPINCVRLHIFNLKDACTGWLAGIQDIHRMSPNATLHSQIALRATVRYSYTYRYYCSHLDLSWDHFFWVFQPCGLHFYRVLALYLTECKTVSVGRDRQYAYMLKVFPGLFVCLLLKPTRCPVSYKSTFWCYSKICLTNLLFKNLKFNNCLMHFDVQRVTYWMNVASPHPVCMLVTFSVSCSVGWALV